MSPKRGSKLRKAICDTFRVPMKREVNGQKIVFVIHQLKASQSWAFINCTLQLSNGKPINWTNSKHAESATDGDLENVAVGLLKKDRLGNWAVVEHAFNFTDVIWTEWATKHNAPSGLFR